MNKSNKISVIIPTYNRGKLIKKSIKSVLNQTYQNIEVIVVDDGSTDNTESIVKNIKDKRLRYIKLEENKGACFARNIGIKNAKGTYISFQDSDDIFYSNKLEVQLNNLLKNKSDIDFCKLKYHDFNTEFSIPNKEQEELIKKGKIIDELCKGNFISTQALLVKKDILDNIHFDDALPRFQDYDLVLRIVPKYKISYSDQSLVDLYKQVDSIGNCDEKLKKACKIMIRKKYSLNEEQQNNLLNTLIFFSIKNEYDNLNKKIVELNNENESYKCKYDKLEKEYGIINKNYNELNCNYNKIINSKRWKFLTKVCKYLGR